MKVGGKTNTAMSQNEPLLALMNNLADGVIQIDHHGLIQLYNASALNILDTNVTLTGLKINDILRLKDLSDQPIDIIKKLKTVNKITVIDDVIYAYETGENLRLEITITPIHDNSVKDNISGYILLIRDVTKFKNLEQERDEFVSVVSHELRTPVTIVEATLSNLNLLIEKNGDLNIIKEIAKTAHDQTVNLAKMLNDIASLGRAERTNIKTDDEVDLDEFINKIYDKYLPDAKAKNLKLNIDKDHKLGKITTSQLYLEEMFQNFITNAIKYTEEGSVTIGARDVGAEIEFYIKDTGIGIPKPDRDKIWNKFYRVEDYRTRETQGTGIGLYVNKRLADKLKTKINLKSRLNHGSTFSFKLKKS